MPSGPKKRRAAKNKKASLEKMSLSDENPQELKPQTDVESEEVAVVVVAAAAIVEEIERNPEKSARKSEIVVSPHPPPSSAQESAKKTVNEVVVEEPEDRQGVQPIVDSYNAEESKQDNLGNLGSGNDDVDQADGSLFLNYLGALISNELEIVAVEPEIEAQAKTGSHSEPQLSVRNEKPCELEPLLSAGKNDCTILRLISSNEYGPMPTDHEKPDEGSSEVLASPVNDESHLFKTDGSDPDPTNGTDLNALPPKRCKTEGAESLPETAISIEELDQTIPLLLTIKARNVQLKECLEAAVHLTDELNVAVTELLKKGQASCQEY